MSALVSPSLNKISPTSCMAGCVISMSNVPIDQRKELIKRIHLLGGTFVNHLTKSSTHLITQDWTTPKSIYARCNKKPVVMSPAWITACEQQFEGPIKHACDQNFDQFKLPIFSGFTLCFSQVPLDKRKIIKKRVEKNGGKYSPNLDPARVTHLILVKAMGEKYKTAVKCGKCKIVHFNWFLDSLAEGIPLPEDRYPPEDVKNKVIHGTPNNSSIENQDETLQTSDKSKYQDISMEKADSSANDNKLDSPTCPVNQQEGIKESSFHNISDLPIEAPQSMIKETETHKVSTKNGTISKSQAPLAGCIICLSKFIDGRLGELYKLIKDLGGTSVPTVDSTTTHLVIRDKDCENTDEYKKAKKLNINIVDINWLRKYSPSCSKAASKRKSTKSFPKLQEFMPLNPKRAKSNLFADQSNKTPDNKDRSVKGSKTAKSLKKAEEFESLLKNLDADQVSFRREEEPEPSSIGEKVSNSQPLKLIVSNQSQSSDSLTDSLPIAWG